MNINGAPVVQDLDIFAAVGADAALVEEYPATAIDGKIGIDFTNKTGNAKIDGIEILGASAPRATQAPYRIKAGGANDFTDGDGNLWEADGHYAGGTTFLSDTPVTGTPIPEVYSAERYNNPDQPMSYTFDVGEGTFLVRMHFAELYFTTTGSRIFSVIVNGQLAVANLDIVAEAGQPNAALIKEFTTASVNGAVKIEFTNVVGNAKISAMEILGLDPTKAGLAANKSPALKLLARSQGSVLSMRVPFPGAYTLTLRDVRGELVERRNGTGVGEQRFTGLRPGIYFIEAVAGGSAGAKTGANILREKICFAP